MGHQPPEAPNAVHHTQAGEMSFEIMSATNATDLTDRAKTSAGAEAAPPPEAGAGHLLHSSLTFGNRENF